MDYTATIPDELVEHYLGRSGFQCPNVRLVRLVAVATQKFVADIASDALQHCKARQSTIVKDTRDKQQKASTRELNRDDLKLVERCDRQLQTNLDRMNEMAPWRSYVYGQSFGKFTPFKLKTRNETVPGRALRTWPTVWDAYSDQTECEYELEM